MFRKIKQININSKKTVMILLSLVCVYSLTLLLSYHQWPSGGAVAAHSGFRAGVQRRSDGSLVRLWLECFRHGSAASRCGCGNAVTRGCCGHCWTLGGDVRTGEGTHGGWLLFKLTGCLVGMRSGSARTSMVSLCSPLPPINLFIYLFILLGIFLPLWGGGRNERKAKEEEDSPAAPWSHALQTA